MDKKQVTLGIDLGGTKIDIGIVDQSGAILRRELIKTNHHGPDSVVTDIRNAVKKIHSLDEHIVAAGVGMAGQIDSLSGLVHFAPNLGWKDFPLGEELEKTLKIPVRVTNDVRAAAWGEWLHGSGQGCDDLVCLFIGTGIGAGIVSGGKMLIGSRNAAGEVGHMTLDLDGPLCTCGNRGCFEALVSGWAIARRAKEMVVCDANEGKVLLELVKGEREEITAKMIFEAYRAKEAIAVTIIQEAKEALIAGVAAIVNAFNPAKVILGGGVINGFPEFVNEIRIGIPRRGLKIAVDYLEIVPAQLKGDAGVIGASSFAFDCLRLDGPSCGAKGRKS